MVEVIEYLLQSSDYMVMATWHWLYSFSRAVMTLQGSANIAQPFGNGYVVMAAWQWLHNFGNMAVVIKGLPHSNGYMIMAT